VFGGAAPVAVDAEPPPAHVERVPERPAEECLWADGQWSWADNQWRWIKGAWVRPSSGCVYAEPLLIWVPSVDGKGVLFFTPGAWYLSSGGNCPAPVSCATRVPD
jgi:WXXGXW repeat (2 copies)